VALVAKEDQIQHNQAAARLEEEGKCSYDVPKEGKKCSLCLLIPQSVASEGLGAIRIVITTIKETTHSVLAVARLDQEVLVRHLVQETLATHSVQGIITTTTICSRVETRSRVSQTLSSEASVGHFLVI